MALDIASIRKEVGSKLEAALNKLLDENVKHMGKSWLKEEGHRLVDKVVDEHYDGVLGGLYAKAKAVVDMIDGEVDNVPAGDAQASAAIEEPKA